MAHYFGVRHFSPACAFFLGELLDRVKPELVLIEGPSDLNELIKPLCGREVKLPAAILSYTEEPPVRTVLYPFAEFSPEYRAMLWAAENGAAAEFCDIPSGAALAYYESAEQRENAESEESGETAKQPSVYDRIQQITGLDDDTFWSYSFEQCERYDDFAAAVGEYGRDLRGFSPIDEHTALREAYMRSVIHKAKQRFDDEKIVVVTGAFHTGALENAEFTDDDERLISSLSLKSSRHTLMPYSYYRLSERSGYGAGSKAPGFFEILWRCRLSGSTDESDARYLAALAGYQRAHGNPTSSAEVIEALRLARTLAEMRGGRQPALSDLRDAAITCLGHGSFGEISLACADTEIGTRIGELPEGTVQTSVQEDFTRRLSELKLERFRTATAEALMLDLRENLRVKSEKSAFLDLNRSFFLHQLRVLDIGFASPGAKQDTDHAELWELRWTPESEIRLVEASLKGDTVEQAAKYAISERLLSAAGLPEASAALSDAFLCGMPDTVKTAVSAVQRMAADCVSLYDAGETIGTLSAIIRFGSIRRLDSQPLHELIRQLFLRFCLGIGGASVCDNDAAERLVSAISRVNDAELSHDFLDGERFISTLTDLAESDMANPLISGFACAVLAERGKIPQDRFSELISRRLSRGTPPADAALWFEGLARKNRRSLLARLSLWEKLSELVDGLSDEEFKPVLVCLRRTFSEFSPSEKSDIAENIGEITGANSAESDAAAEQLQVPLSSEEKQILSELDDFDFDDI